MNAVEFINKCDWEGGLAKVFEYGVIPEQLERTVDPKLTHTIYDAYDAWKKWKDGVKEIFRSGVLTEQVGDGLDQAIDDVYDAWKKFKEAEDHYYTLVETGEY